MPKDPVPPGYILKTTAKKLLGISDRQIERRIKEGYIRRKFLARLPHESAPTTVLSREDVIALKNNKPNRYPTVEAETPIGPERQIGAAAESGPQSVPAQSPVAITSLGELARALVEAWRPAGPSRPFWLTLDEAEAFTGLPGLILRRAAHRQLIIAFHCLVEGRRRWSFDRESLAAFARDPAKVVEVATTPAAKRKTFMDNPDNPDNGETESSAAQGAA